jgi:hypothetical protein
VVERVLSKGEQVIEKVRPVIKNQQGAVNLSYVGESVASAEY